MKDDIIVGHLPRLGAISRICLLFLLSLTRKRALYKGNGRIIFIAKKCSCVLIS